MHYFGLLVIHADSRVSSILNNTFFLYPSAIFSIKSRILCVTCSSLSLPGSVTISHSASFN